MIPALNEAEWIAAAIDAARAAGIDEIIVADGGSSDVTLAIARERDVRIVTGERVRARQLNRGAEAATGDAIVFVHADTLLPAGAADAIRAALQHADFGGFRVAFIEDSPRLRFTAWMINARTRITRCPWGDQAQFVRRAAFAGFRDFPLMEDYELAVRMKHRAVVLPLAVRTSGRRFLRKGVLRTAAINWAIVAAYRLGVSPETLARWYRG